MFNNQKLFQNQTIIIQMISTGAPLRKIMSFIANGVEENFHPQEAVVTIMIYNEKTRKLEHAFSPVCHHIHDFPLEPVDVGPYEGSCGTAAFLKRPILVEDIETSPIWAKRREQVSRLGFRASAAVPILSSKKELLGSLSVYFRKPFRPSNEMLEVLNFYNRLTSLAIEFSKSPEFQEMPSVISPLYSHQDNVPLSEEKLLFQLHEAIEREELEIHYQPYIGVKRGGLGLEALIRWNHPTSGMLTPASFLDIAEKSGFILEIENWVLDKSLRQIKGLHERGSKNLRLSVNISAGQFSRDSFPNTIERLLEEYSFSPEKLTLEVTERFLIQESNVAALDRLKDMGVRISIDDFGVSYSSLKYLQEFSVDELKIDRTFTAKMERDVNSQKIVEAIIKLGHSLGLNIIAEGVETENQFELLKGMNCDMVQGFLFSRPKPLNHLLSDILTGKIM